MEQVGEEARPGHQQTREVIDQEAQRVKALKRSRKNVAKKFPKTLGAGAIVAAVVDENVLTGGHGAWDIHRNEDDETDDDEVYRCPGQPVAGGPDEVGEWAACPLPAVRYGWSRTPLGSPIPLTLHLRVRVRKLFDLDTQRLKFNAQLHNNSGMARGREGLRFLRKLLEGL